MCPRVPALSLEIERMAGSCSLLGGGVSLEPPNSHVVICLPCLGGSHGTLFGRLLRSLAWIFSGVLCLVASFRACNSITLKKKKKKRSVDMLL